jgi:hypothetical protein
VKSGSKNTSIGGTPRNRIGPNNLKSPSFSQLARAVDPANAAEQIASQNSTIKGEVEPNEQVQPTSSSSAGLALLRLHNWPAVPCSSVLAALRWTSTHFALEDRQNDVLVGLFESTH